MRRASGRLREWERLTRLHKALRIPVRTLRDWVSRGLLPARQAEPGATIFANTLSARELANRRYPAIRGFASKPGNPGNIGRTAPIAPICN